MNSEVCNDIEKTVYNIISQIKNCDYEYTDQTKKLFLTHEYFKFSWIDLVYLFLEIQKIYELNFVENDVLDYKFLTIENIVEIINLRYKC